MGSEVLRDRNEPWRVARYGDYRVIEDRKGIHGGSVCVVTNYDHGNLLLAAPILMDLVRRIYDDGNASKHWLREAGDVLAVIEGPPLEESP